MTAGAIVTMALQVLLGLLTAPSFLGALLAAQLIRFRSPAGHNRPTDRRIP